MQEVGSPEERGLATPLKTPAALPLPQRRLSTAFDSPHKTPAKASKRQSNGRDEDGSGPGKKSRDSDVR